VNTTLECCNSPLGPIMFARARDRDHCHDRAEVQRRTNGDIARFRLGRRRRSAEDRPRRNIIARSDFRAAASSISSAYDPSLWHPRVSNTVEVDLGASRLSRRSHQPVASPGHRSSHGSSFTAVTAYASEYGFLSSQHDTQITADRSGDASQGRSTIQEHSGSATRPLIHGRRSRIDSHLTHHATPSWPGQMNLRDACRYN